MSWSLYHTAASCQICCRSLGVSTPLSYTFRLKNQDRGKEIPMTGTHVTIAATDRATFDSYVASPVSEKGAGVIIVYTISGVDSVMTYYADTLAAKRFIATAPDMIRRAASTRT